MRARNSGISQIWVSWISAVACVFIRNLLFSFLNTRIRELRKLIKAHKQCINSWNSYLAYCDGKFNIRSTKLFDLHNTSSLKHGFKIKSSESHYKDLFKFTFYYVHRIFLPKHSDLQHRLFLHDTNTPDSYGKGLAIFNLPTLVRQEGRTALCYSILWKHCIIDSVWTSRIQSTVNTLCV